MWNTVGEETWIGWREGGGKGEGATGDKQPTCTTPEEKSSGKPKDRDSTHDHATAKVRYLRAD